MEATPQTIESLLALQRAKTSEKEVDRIINELDNPNQPKQGELL